MGFLFGDDPEVTVRKELSLTPPQQDLQDLTLYPFLMGQRPYLSQNPALHPTFPTYGGPISVSPNQYYKSSLSALEDFSRGMAAQALEMPEWTPPLSQRDIKRYAKRGVGNDLPEYQMPDMGPLREAGSYITQLLGKGPRDLTDYFRTAVEGPLTERFQKDILPSISRNFAPSGFYSSQRLETERRANEDLADTLAQVESEAAFSEFWNLVNSQLTGSSLAPSVVGTEANINKIPVDYAALERQLDLSEGMSAVDRILEQSGMELSERQSIINAALQGLQSAGTLGLGVSQEANRVAEGNVGREIGIYGTEAAGQVNLENARAALMLEALRTGNYDVITEVDPGSEGLVPGLMKSAGTGIGAALGSQLGTAVGGVFGGVTPAASAGIRPSMGVNRNNRSDYDFFK